MRHEMRPGLTLHALCMGRRASVAADAAMMLSPLLRFFTEKP